jgi:hypothetical protein
MQSPANISKNPDAAQHRGSGTRDHLAKKPVCLMGSIKSRQKVNSHLNVNIHFLFVK